MRNLIGTLGLVALTSLFPGSVWATNSTAELSQDGSDNQGTISQSTVLDSDATIRQNGTSHVSNILQVRNTRASATIDANRTRNSARSAQFDSFDAKTSIRQFGDQGIVSVDQARSDGSSVNVSQLGFSLLDRATVRQGDAAGSVATVQQLARSLFGGGQNQAQIDQVGLNLNALVLQNDTLGSSATIDQNGLGLNASIQQLSARQATATIVQTGSVNNATVLQSNVGAGTLAEIDQSGQNNAADIAQSNSQGSSSRIVQAGMLNTAGIDQSSSFSSAVITQSSVGDTGTILQANGSNNLAQVTQN